MKLPKRRLVRVDYRYDNGKRYSIIGKAVENYQANMRAQGTFYAMRGDKFKVFLPVNWQMLNDNPIKEPK